MVIGPFPDDSYLAFLVWLVFVDGEGVCVVHCMSFGAMLLLLSCCPRVARKVANGGGG